jgi:hypothetical protein
MDYSGYQGETRNSVPHGYGTITFPNGNRYEGRWVNGKRTGFGKYFYSNGSRYEGEVQDGHLHGHGVLTFANGNHYEGKDKMVSSSLESLNLLPRKYSLRYNKKN